MRRLVVALAFVFASASADAAQIVELEFDLGVLGLGNVDLHGADVDGDPSTFEFLLHATDSERWALGSMTAAGDICLENWFDPRPQTTGTPFPAVGRWTTRKDEIFGRTKIIVERDDFFMPGQTQRGRIVGLKFDRCR